MLSHPSTQATTSQRNEATSITVRVNDQPRVLTGPTTLTQLLDELGLAGRQGMAVAINDAIVLRAHWMAHCLTDGDHVLIIQATQGG